MINNYNDFILESKLYQLLLESNLQYLDKFFTILRELEDNSDKGVAEIASNILYLNNKKDLPILPNYIDIDEDPGKISFYPDNKVQYSDIVELVKNSTGYYRTVSIKHQIIKNLKIPTDNVMNTKFESNHTNIPNKWRILNTYKSGDLYTFYLIENVELENYRLIVYDLEDEFGLTQAFRQIPIMPKSPRASVKIGKFVNKALDIYYKDKFNLRPKASTVEKFNNAFAAAVLYHKNMTKNFEIVKGESIKHWYLFKSYSNNDSQLGSSCMRHHTCQDFFSIYIENPDVCQLLILKDNTGEKIIGRALLWTDTDGKKWMDRIYCNKDSYMKIFEKYAKDNRYENIYNKIKAGEKINVKVKIKNKDYGKYPFIDAFSTYIPTFKEHIKEEFFFTSEKVPLPEFDSIDKPAYLYSMEPPKGNKQAYLKLNQTNGEYLLLDNFGVTKFVIEE